ncbi:ATP-binding protein [Niveibacterium sp. COAC-50]|uniref:AAA family ATPase n=1 Tax=Niveibacterium sp. COAC-50 TaxID=2729384 RepID=UPI00155342EB|nr:ATP-binding protein [Niveibacterium sp. COAC-50]
MSANVIRHNLARLLGFVQMAAVVLAFLMVLTTHSFDPYREAAAVGDVGGLMLFFAIYFVAAALVVWLGGVERWWWPSAMLTPVVIFMFRAWEWMNIYIEVFVVGASLAGIILLRELIKRPGFDRTRGHAGWGEGAADGPGEESLQFPAVKAKASFANVVGMEDVKSRLADAGNAIVAAGRKGATARNGILLTGDPGNGKSFFAEALAGELKLPFIAVSFAHLSSQWLNKTTVNAKRLFDEARAQAPCVLFLDEIDAVIRDRSSMSTSSEEAPKTTAAMLTMLVDIRDAGVVVVAATNHLDRLDPAAVREGRFDFKIEVAPPDLPARRAIIADAVRKCSGVRFEQSALDQAAKRWQGYSVARLKAVIEQAGLDARKRSVRSVSYEHLQAAMRTVQGRRGHIPEDTPNVEQVAMAPADHAALLSVADRMKSIEDYEEFGATVPTGMLFSGPPGTGKTLTARALAKSTGWAFLEISGNTLISDPSKIDDLVKTARDIRPVIVFLDEADDVLGDRAYAPSHVVSATNKLLQAIDGSGGKVHDVVWIAATNHPEKLDSAALRGGRFSEKFEFATPTADVIAGYVGNWKSVSKASIGNDVTDGFCAEVFAGESIANIKEALQQATNHAVSRAMREGIKQPTITADDIKAGLRRVSG